MWHTGLQIFQLTRHRRGRTASDSGVGRHGVGDDGEAAVGCRRRPRNRGAGPVDVSLHCGGGRGRVRSFCGSNRRVRQGARAAGCFDGELDQVGGAGHDPGQFDGRRRRVRDDPNGVPRRPGVGLNPVGVRGYSGVDPRIGRLRAAVPPADDTGQIGGAVVVVEHDGPAAVALARVCARCCGTEHCAVDDLAAGVLATAGVDEDGGRLEPGTGHPTRGGCAPSSDREFLILGEFRAGRRAVECDRSGGAQIDRGRQSGDSDVVLECPGVVVGMEVNEIDLCEVPGLLLGRQLIRIGPVFESVNHVITG